MTFWKKPEYSLYVRPKVVTRTGLIVLRLGIIVSSRLYLAIKTRSYDPETRLYRAVNMTKAPIPAK